MISDAEFQAIRTLVYDRFGINLTEQKRSLVIGRLQKVLRRHGFSTYQQYLGFLSEDRTGEAISELINQISTNHTFFFREPEHFHFLVKTALPEIIGELERKQELDLRIWSAGCSSGEEPYTIAIVLREFFGLGYSAWRAGVFATDISADVLKRAGEGIFPVERLTKTPEPIRKKYFRRLSENQYAVNDEIRKDVTFRRFNLMRPDFPFKKPFHLISCRNVMIYFDAVTRSELTRKFHRSMAPGGYLFIGHSETLGRDDECFDYVCPAIYRRKE
jgi:chemotaxis protein methyltransferase CheR